MKFSLFILCLNFLVGCGNSDSDNKQPMQTNASQDADDKSTDDSAATGDDINLDQMKMVPPQGADAMLAWITNGYYLEWNCEAEPHAARPSSPHGRNRICSNDLLSTNEAELYPIGAAGVKEIYADDSIAGYAVYLKTTDEAGGASWYWYEILNSGVIADGIGDAGIEKNVCVGCHVKAEKDMVFTQVMAKEPE